MIYRRSDMSEGHMRLGSRLAHATGGVALIEFALALPMMLMLVFGGIELAHFIIAWQTVTQVANLAADNASRGENALDESNINEIFVGVGKAAKGLGLDTNGRVILSGIQANSAGTGLWIRWQRCSGSLTTSTSAYGVQGKGQSDTSLPSISGLTPSSGSALILVEVAYNYQPLFNFGFTSFPTLRHKSVYIVRQRSDYSLTNNANQTQATC
jgi:Flp pilus assembly protein TadG